MLVFDEQLQDPLHTAQDAHQTEQVAQGQIGRFVDRI